VACDQKRTQPVFRYDGRSYRHRDWCCMGVVRIGSSAGVLCGYLADATQEVRERNAHHTSQPTAVRVRSWTASARARVRSRTDTARLDTRYGRHNEKRASHGLAAAIL